MSVTLGIDFGALNTRIYVKDRGIVLREPTAAAVDTLGNVVAVGTEALLIHGRAPGTVTVRRPISDNQITDFNLAAEMLDRFLELAAPRVKKHIFATTKYSLGSKSRELLRNALSDCRSGRITLIDSAVAALMGSGFDTQYTDDEFSGTVICDIGAGASESAYVRNGELLRADVNKGGGDAADQGVITYLRQTYGLAVSQRAAREAKHRLDLTSPPIGAEIMGLDGSTAMPRRISITTDELLRPCAPQINGAASAIKATLGSLPRHGLADSAVDSIILVGGGAEIPGIAETISELIGCEAISASEPSDAAVLGLGRIIENG